MRALVVYESMFGNTEAVASAIGEGLAEYMEVDVREVGQAPSPLTEPVDLIVVGAPTHAFSLSRASTRAEAVRQGATHGTVERGLREWLGQLPDGPHVERVAAFDTRVTRGRRLPGSAARKALRIAHDHGYAIAGTDTYYVEGTSGPLLAGELGRAWNWGADLASAVPVRTV